MFSSAFKAFKFIIAIAFMFATDFPRLVSYLDAPSPRVDLIYANKSMWHAL